MDVYKFLYGAKDPDIIIVIAKQCLKQQKKGMHKNTLADNFWTTITGLAHVICILRKKNYVSEQYRAITSHL